VPSVLEMHSPEQHSCDTYQCRFCKEYGQQLDHLCYQRAEEPVSISDRFCFFDIECTASTVNQCKEGYNPTVPRGSLKDDCSECKAVSRTCTNCSMCQNCKDGLCGSYLYEPNLLCVQTACNDCRDEDLDPGTSKCHRCGDRCDQCREVDKDTGQYTKPPCAQTCGFRQKLFRRPSACREFVNWITQPDRKNFNILAHNAKGEYLYNPWTILSPFHDYRDLCA